MSNKSNQQILSSLEGNNAGPYSIVIKNISEGRFAEESYFELYLKNINDVVSVNPVINGIYNSGRSKYYRSWIEVDFSNKTNFESEEKKLGDDLLIEIFQNISEIIPSGGWIYVIYENHEETMNQLKSQIPFPLTRIGFFLYHAGCVWFKDWYFSEGFKEGRKKLQGEKYVDENHKKKRSLEIYESISNFIERKEINSVMGFSKIKNRAGKILKEIEEAYPEELN